MLADALALRLASVLAVTVVVIVLWRGEWVLLALSGGASLLICYAVSPPPRPPPPRPETVPTILIVEDNPVLRDLVARDVERMPARVLKADSLAAARAILRVVRLDAALVDLGLPDGSGLDLIRALRSGQSPPTSRDVPVVVFSGISSLRAHDILMLSGAMAFVEKPFPADEPVRSLREALALRIN